MTLSARYAPVLFSGILSLVMVAIVSATVVAINQGISSDFGIRWLNSFITAWPVAFPTLLVLAPRVRRLVERMTT